MKTFSLCLLALFLFAANVHADTIQGDYPACLTEELWEQLGIARRANDTDAINWLGKHGCFMPQKGLHVLRISGYLLIKVRTFIGDDSITFYTPMENVIRQGRK